HGCVDGVSAACARQGTQRGTDGGSGGQAEKRAGCDGREVHRQARAPGRGGFIAGEQGMTVTQVMGWGCVAALSVSLALARVHPFGDAGLYARRDDAEVIPAGAGMPADVRRMLENKCADCHSSVTRAPFYGRFAPISWLLERD